MQCQIFFSLFDTFSHLRNLKENVFREESLYHKDSNMFRQFNKVKPCLINDGSTWMGDQM